MTDEELRDEFADLVVRIIDARTEQSIDIGPYIGISDTRFTNTYFGNIRLGRADYPNGNRARIGVFVNEQRVFYRVLGEGGSHDYFDIDVIRKLMPQLLQMALLDLIGNA